MFKRKAPNQESGLLDTSIRPICFGIDNKVTKESASSVGPQKFKRYEHTLYIMAQLSRLVYCDTGIMWNVIEKSLGLSNDIVNKVITAYDAKYIKEKRLPIKSQPGNSEGRPMESYSLMPSQGKNKYATYISTPDDMTCLVIKASKIKANANSIFLPTDVIVSFKGSSTMDNFKHDIMSQFSATDIQKLAKQTGITFQGTNNLVTGSFVVPLVKAWSALMGALDSNMVNGRLFLTGHSLGGAYATLFCYMLAEGRQTIPALKKVQSIHLITFGAPCVFRDASRNSFNKHLDSGFVTLDRVVSQKIAARSAATQLLMGGIAGPNDVIPTIPVGFCHPGYRPLANPLKNFKPEANGRPYSIDFIRKFYGVQTSTRYRDPQTWPFPDPVELGDRKQKEALKEKVTQLTSLQQVPDEQEPAAPDVKVSQDPQPLEGGGPDKALYEATTLKRIPNFVSVQGSVYAYGFAHAEYLGMFFFGGFRLAGMKNPASKNRIASFDLCPDGVKIQYTTMNPVSKNIEAINVLAKASNNTRVNQQQSAGRKTRKNRI
jgi:hypothetical protein